MTADLSWSFLDAQALEEAEVDFGQSLVTCPEVPQKRQSLLSRWCCAKSFKFCFCFDDWIIGSEVGFKFLSEQLEIQKPSRLFGSKSAGLKQSNVEPFR